MTRPVKGRESNDRHDDHERKDDRMFSVQVVHHISWSVVGLYPENIITFKFQTRPPSVELYLIRHNKKLPIASDHLARKTRKRLPKSEGAFLSKTLDYRLLPCECQQVRNKIQGESKREYLSLIPCTLSLICHPGCSNQLLS